jgi:hypothetical protein
MPKTFLIIHWRDLSSNLTKVNLLMFGYVVPGDLSQKCTSLAWLSPHNFILFGLTYSWWFCIWCHCCALVTYSGMKCYLCMRTTYKEYYAWERYSNISFQYVRAEIKNIVQRIPQVQTNLEHDNSTFNIIHCTRRHPYSDEVWTLNRYFLASAWRKRSGSLSRRMAGHSPSSK